MPSSNSSNAESRFCLRGEINGVEQVFSLRPGLQRVGALESNDVSLPLTGVSRLHAELRIDGERLRVKDVASKNGTFVEGRRVEEATLDLGTDLRFGPVSLRFQEFHPGDAELAIAFEHQPPQQTANFPVLDRRSRTASTDALALDWLRLADQVQEHLLERGSSIGSALQRIRDDLGCESILLFEVPIEGSPIVSVSAGQPPDRPPTELLAAIERLRHADLGTHFEHIDHSETLAVLALHRLAGRDALALVALGRFPGRGECDVLLRLVLHMLEAAWPGTSFERPAADHEFPGLILPEGYVYGRSEAMRQLYGLMQTLAQGDLPILIIGETGVGKEYLARILHSSSPRRRGPFVAINCAAIPAELLEAELFGIGSGVATGVTARKGRFQMAEGGTLFLDEIGDMSADLQAKLLRALQEKEVHPLGNEPAQIDVRVLAATNQELAQRIEAGSFRADLYYRLAGYVLDVPPLRERKDDIPPLVEHFLRSCASDLNRSIRGLTVHALRMLTEYPWPGNVRELANEVRRAVYLCPDHRTIESTVLSKPLRDHYESLGESGSSPPGSSSSGSSSSGSGTLASGVPEVPASRSSGSSSGISERTLRIRPELALDSLDLATLERRAVLEALRRCGDNQVQAAKLLGISRQALRRRMERIGVLGKQDSA